MDEMEADCGCGCLAKQGKKFLFPLKKRVPKTSK